jgi:26S proteasome regulatory subunit N5
MVSGKADGGQLEERIDLSSETESKISQAQSLIASSPTNLSSALSLLASIEKRARVGNDTPSLLKVCEASLQLCKDCNDEESLIDTIKMLTTRRSQKSKAIGACVNKTLPWVLESGSESDDGDGMKGYVPLAVSTDEQKVIREKLVVTLRDVTDGKLFLEAERARLTRALAIIKVSFDKLICFPVYYLAVFCVLFITNSVFFVIITGRRW